MTATYEYIDALEAYLTRCGAQLVRTMLPDWIHGRVRADLIAVRAGLPPEQELLTLVHEMTHWLAHRHLGPEHSRTLFEYEAEAVEALVMGRLGLPHPEGAHGKWRDHPTDDLLAVSVQRVTEVTRRIFEALGLDSAALASRADSEAQAAVDFEAAAREEVVLEYELHGVGDFLGLPQAL
jgi:hypothetical protein